jgi:hypothetical protein
MFRRRLANRRNGSAAESARPLLERSLTGRPGPMKIARAGLLRDPMRATNIVLSWCRLFNITFVMQAPIPETGRLSPSDSLQQSLNRVVAKQMRERTKPVNMENVK